ncbi:MAG: GNAT family N-acetyltransferase [Pyrinomonadaceae bacterium]
MPAQPNDTAYRLSVLRTSAEWDEPRLRKRWIEITNQSENVNAIYTSPVWFDLLRERHRPEELALAVAYDPGGDVVGLAPILFKNHPFQYYLSRYPIITRQLRAAHILGSVPMFPADPLVNTQLLDLLLDAQVDCVYMDTVPIEDPFLKSVTKTWRNNYLVYAPGGPRPWHLLQLPAHSDAYLSRMSSKARATLRKNAKKLAESAGGKLEVTRIDSEQQVGDFLADAVRVSQNSWQHDILGDRITDSEEERAWCRSLARAGLLRNYVLKCGARPCAFVVGYQFNGVFHYVEVGYDREFSENSPGTVLLDMLIQDLCDYDPPTLLNFGMGEAGYKRRFGNVQREDTSIVAFRKSLNNYVLVRSHALLRSMVRVVRRIVKK